MTIRTFFSNTLMQFKNHRQLLGIAYFLPLVVVLTLVAIQPYAGIDQLTRDTAEYLKVEVYIGVISDLGIYMWIASLTMCYFFALVFARVSLDNTIRHFLLVMGTFSLVLFVDDRFLLHDRIIPNLFPPNIRIEIFIYLFYFMVAVYIAIRFKDLILSSNYIFLLMAIFFFGFSTSFDFIKDLLNTVESSSSIDNAVASTINTSRSRLREYAFLIEDGTKIAGIAAWLLFIFNFCYHKLNDIIESNVK